MFRYCCSLILLLLLLLSFLSIVRLVAYKVHIRKLCVLRIDFSMRIRTRILIRILAAVRKYAYANPLVRNTSLHIFSSKSIAKTDQSAIVKLLVGIF